MSALSGEILKRKQPFKYKANGFSRFLLFKRKEILLEDILPECTNAVLQTLTM